MIGFGWVGDRRREAEDLRSQRHRALMRAAMALALVFALLLTLLLIRDDADDAPPDDLFPELALAPLPAPPPVAPLEAEESETAAVPPADEPEAGSAPVEVIDVEPATVARVEHPRPIMVENADTPAASPPPAPSPRRPAAQRPPAGAAAPAARTAKPATAERKALPAKREAPAGSGAYRVVIGDFLEPLAANKLCDKLMNTGYTLVMQHRVVVGPYAERSKAEAAISTLQREQQMRGMVVNAPEGNGLMVQLGVFSEAANAQSMLSRLVAAGYPAQVHMRIMTSPFADKQTAESALTKLQQTGSVKGVIVAAP